MYNINLVWTSLEDRILQPVFWTSLIVYITPPYCTLPYYILFTVDCLYLSLRWTMSLVDPLGTPKRHLSSSSDQKGNNGGPKQLRGGE